MVKEKEIFSIIERGYKAIGYYLEKPNDDNVLVEVFCNEELIREFTWPAYKIWNIPAHFSDILDSEIKKNKVGYKLAGSNGLGGGVYTAEVENTK